MDCTPITSRYTQLITDIMLHGKVRTSEGQGVSQGNHVLRKLVRLVVETNTMTGESGHNDHSSVES